MLFHTYIWANPQHTQNILLIGYSVPGLSATFGVGGALARVGGEND